MKSVTHHRKICERRWGELRKGGCNAVLSRPTWNTKAAFLAAVMVLGTCCARFRRASYLSKTEIPSPSNAPKRLPLCKRNQSATIKGFSGAPMDTHFKRVTDAEALDALIENSNGRPLVIFKHSLTCPISSAAYDQMTRYEGEVALLEVQKARALSNAIESRFGVTHESPQVIVLRKGQVFWNASHFKITAEAVARAVREAGEAV